MAGEVDDAQFEAFLRSLDKWPDFALEAAEPSVMQSLLFLHGQLPEYPPTPEQGVGFVSSKQRAWFFAAVRAGEVPGWRWVERSPSSPGSPAVPAHPEKLGSARTGNLGRKFTETVLRADWNIIGDLGTNVPYAPWVVGPSYPGEEINGQTMYQARIHQGRWWQLAVVFAENEEQAWAIFQKEFWPRFRSLATGGNP